MSALPPTDIRTQSWNVRFVPKADIPEIGGLRQRDDLIDVLFDGGVQRGTHILKAS
jgi:isopentenyl diphosphate isomerase/L-lactate dehydrogenase-like FMN-dependent dehydrogenase